MWHALDSVWTRSSKAGMSGVTARGEAAGSSPGLRSALTVKRFAKSVLTKESRLMLRRLYYAGTRYYCSACERRARTMFFYGFSFPVLSELDVIGGEPFLHDTCPICHGNGRSRLLCEYIRRELKIGALTSAIRVLHVAPEDSIRSLLKGNRKVEYVGVDMNPAQYGKAGITRCDITSIGWRDESFDLIICSHVLEHIPDDRHAMRELLRVLKPGGTAILQVPISARLQQTVEDPYLTDPKECERRFGQYDHVRIYGADYPTRLRDAGFLVEIFDPVSQWGADVDRLRLNPREKIFIGRKARDRRPSAAVPLRRF
jgi:SAM-dependent methyltransferase